MSRDLTRLNPYANILVLGLGEDARIERGRVAKLRSQRWKHGMAMVILI